MEHLQCMNNEPVFEANLETSPKSKKTGITLVGTTRFGIIITFICYIGFILLAAFIFAIIFLLRKKQDRDYIVAEKIDQPEIVVPRLCYTMIGFSVVLCLIDIIHRKAASYMVRKENHRTYESISLSLTKHLYILCFAMPAILLAYFAFQTKIFKLWAGTEKTGYYGPSTEYNYSIYDNMCVMTSCLYELSFTFTIVLLLRFVILRKLSLYSSLTDYNQRAVVDNVPCWEREFTLPRFKETILINKMKILVTQFSLIIAFGFAWPPTIIVILFFDVYDMRRDAQLCTLHYRRPLLLKNKAFNIWTEILKLMIYFAIIVNVVSLVCASDTIEAYLVEGRRYSGGNHTVFFYLGLYFRHEHTYHRDLPTGQYICCNTRGYAHIIDDQWDQYYNYQGMLTMDELRTYQYMYIFIFEFVMSALFKLLQFIFSIDVDEMEIPKTLFQQRREAKALQDITKEYKVAE